MDFQAPINHPCEKKKKKNSFFRPILFLQNLAPGEHLPKGSVHNKLCYILGINIYDVS